MAVTINGSTGIEYDDNVKHILGTGDDLQLYHDGSNSYIKSSTNSCAFLGGMLQINDLANAKNSAQFDTDGAVELYHDNAKVFYTESYGATIKRPSGGATQLSIYGCEGQDAEILLASDDGDDNGDRWKLIAETEQDFSIKSYLDGSWNHCFWTNGVASYLYYSDAAKIWTNSAGATIEADLTLYKAGGSSSTQLHMWGQDVHQYSVYTGAGNFRWWSEVDGDTIAEVQQDGDIRIDGSYQTGGVDYAEYFESTDGSAIAVGTTVVLDNGKVRAATGSETPIGVIRPKTSGTSVTGGSHDINWQGKYLADDYDGILKENETYCTWKEGDEPKQCWKDRPPTGVTIPDDAVETTKSRKKLNPSFDASKTYVPRSERTEWNCVGLLGQIPITKGQPTSTNWIKMKERSSTVELWMVK